MVCFLLVKDITYLEVWIKPIILSLFNHIFQLFFQKPHSFFLLIKRFLPSSFSSSCSIYFSYLCLNDAIVGLTFKLWNVNVKFDGTIANKQKEIRQICLKITTQKILLTCLSITFGVFLLLCWNYPFRHGAFYFFAIFAVTEYGAFTMNISTTMLNCKKQGLFLAVRG